MIINNPFRHKTQNIANSRRSVRIFDASCKDGVAVEVRHHQISNAVHTTSKKPNHLTWGGVVIILSSTLILAAFGGCSQSKTSEDKQRHRPESKVEKGPVEMLVRADRDQAQIAEPVQLEVQVQAEKGVSVKFPKAEKELGDFKIVSSDDTPDVPLDGGDKRLWTRRYKIESLKSGKLKIPAVTVDFTDNRNPEKPIHSQLTSKELDMQITSMLEGKADPAKFRDIKGAVEIPAEPSYTWVWIPGSGLGAIGVALSIAVLITRVKRNRVLRADQWALAQLARLESDGLVEAGQIEGFYIRLTNIIRAYIERRFRIHAPNLTTREFLEEAHSHPKLEEYRDELRENLQAADMVKFAKFRPGLTECQNTMETARQFVVASAATNKIRS